MNKLKLILDSAAGILKPVKEILSDHRGNLSSKRVYKIFGGGSLITVGVGMLSTAEALNSPQFIGGCFLVVLGVIAGKLMSTEDPKELK